MLCHVEQIAVPQKWEAAHLRRRQLQGSWDADMRKCRCGGDAVVCQGTASTQCSLEHASCWQQRSASHLLCMGVASLWLQVLQAESAVQECTR